MEVLLCRNYTYLRDRQACGFQDFKLMSKLTENLMDSVFINPASNKTPPKDTSKPKRWSCTHCHGDFHTGGSAKCPLEDDETKDARAMAKKIEKRLAGTSDADKDKVISEVREAM
jgi:hypothetical protein